MRRPFLKIVTVVFLSILTVLSFSQPYKSSERVKFLRKLDGKYPFEVNLLGNPIMKKGIKKLTGDKFEFIKKYFDVQIPIVIENNFFIAEGCRPHECPETNFIIIVDLTKDVLYVGIRDNLKIQIFSEDKSPQPEQFKNWVENIWYKN